MNWYTTSKENDLQGLVCDEDTGKNIAVSYDAKDAQLIAAAPELLKALDELVMLIENSQYADDPEYQEALAAIARAKGE